jgi:hypothetical protein
LGIEGKRTLWHTLLAAAEEKLALRKVDFDRLDRRLTISASASNPFESRLRVMPLRLQNLVAESCQ